MSCHNADRFICYVPPAGLIIYIDKITGRGKHYDQRKTGAAQESVMPYANAETRASIIQLLNTILPFFVFWFLAYQTLSISFWLSLPFSVITAGSMIRSFIIFHDCTHGSFFRNKKLNDFCGTFTGVITHFAYEKWKREHSIHHATSGNLDKRGIGD